MRVFAMVMVICLVLEGYACVGQCTGTPSQRDPSACPDRPCKIKGCDFKTDGQCLYANTPCNTCSAFEGAKVDFVFLIDASGSMADEINAVEAGLTRFVQFTPTIGLDAHYAVIMFGASSIANGHHMLQPLTGNSAAVISALDFASNHASGGWEPALEGLYKASNQAPSRTYLTNTIAVSPASPTMSSTNINIPWRTGASRNVILLTDEDSDIPYSSSNYASGYRSSPQSFTCTGDAFPSLGRSGYKQEVADVAAALISQNIRLFSLLRLSGSSSSCVPAQFGTWSAQVMHDDFRFFSRELTLQNYKQLSTNRQEALQYRMLEAGVMSRIYNIDNIDEPAFVDNFFQSLLDDSKLCDPCVSSTCNPATSMCVNSPLCSDADPCTVDSCTVSVTDEAICAFTQRPVVNVSVPDNGLGVNPCVNYACDPRTGNFDVPVVKQCDGVSSDPCKEFRCIDETGECGEAPRICTLEPGSDPCLEAYCDEQRSCQTRLRTDDPNCIVPGVCDPVCNPAQGNCTTENRCVCYNGWSGPQCYVPPCEATCLNNGTCTVKIDPECDATIPVKDLPRECFVSTCDCLPGFARPSCTPVAPTPSPEILSETNVAIGASVAALVIIAAVVLAVVLYRVKGLYTELADLDALSGSNGPSMNPLYEEASGWKVNAIAE